ncbi:MAG: helix-turn-helix transcriptional regulator [PVC group bacterium]|nr:helix-turn-helix transcriptional regulator [PVC group bacterium]
MSEYNEPRFERIRRIRLLRLKYLNDKSCSEKEFAKVLNVKVGELKKIESGKIEPNAEMLNNLSTALGVSIEHIVSEKLMWEDQSAEPVIYKSQIGSVIHATRIKLGKTDWKEYSLKSMADKLGISSMELKRIEDLGKSKYLAEKKFLEKVAKNLNVSFDYIKAIAEKSFPRGKDKKHASLKNIDQVFFTNDGAKRNGLLVLGFGLNIKKLEILKKRIELEIELLKQ